MERSARMTWVDYFSSLGGLFGLCLGFSVISFIEVSISLNIFSFIPILSLDPGDLLGGCQNLQECPVNTRAKHVLNYLLDKNETSLWHHNRFWDKTKTGKKGRKISGNSHSILFINMVDGGAKEINGGANLVK